MYKKSLGRVGKKCLEGGHGYPAVRVVSVYFGVGFFSHHFGATQANVLL